MKEIKTLFIGRGDKNNIAKTILRFKEHKYIFDVKNPKYQFQYSLWNGKSINICIDVFEPENINEWNQYMVYSSHDIIFIVLQLPLTTEDFNCALAFMKRIGLKETYKIVVNAKHISLESHRQHVSSQLGKYKEFQMFEILHSASYFNDNLEFDSSTFSDEYFLKLESLINQLIKSPINVSLYQSRTKLKKKDLIKSKYEKLLKTVNIPKILEPTPVSYRLFQQVFQNKYIRNYIFRKVREINLCLGLESRKFNQISDYWCIYNNLEPVLLDKIRYDDSFFITKESMAIFCKRNQNFNLFRLLLDKICLYDSSEYPIYDSFLTEQCAIGGNIEIIIFLYKQGYTFSLEGFHNAISYGRLEVVKFFVEHLQMLSEHDLSAKSKALDLAKLYKFKEIKNYLKSLNFGIINQKHNQGETQQ